MSSVEIILFVGDEYVLMKLKGRDLEPFFRICCIQPSGNIRSKIWNGWLSIGQNIEAQCSKKIAGISSKSEGFLVSSFLPKDL